VKPRPFKILLVSLLLASASGGVLAADGSVEPPFRFYSVADGLTQSEVYDIEQDKAGYLWFTTARGLNRFDGREFDNYTIADGLQSNRLTALEIAGDNAVWVGDEEGGITVLRGGTVTERIPPLSAENTPVLDIEVIDGEALVIIEDIGIVHVVGEPGELSMKSVAGEWTGARNMVEFGGFVWFVGSEGLYSMKLVPQPTIRHVRKDILLVDAGEEALWLIDKERRLGRFVDFRFEPVATIPGDAELVSLASDSIDNVWTATRTRLFKIAAGSGNGDGPAEVRDYNGFDELASLYVDQERTLWLSSSSRLVRFLGDRFQHYKLKTGSDPETIWAISQDRNGRMWFGTQSHVMLRNEDETLTVLGEEHGVARGAVRDLVRDNAGYLWAGIHDHGVYRISPRALRGELVEGTRGLSVLDLAVSDSKDLWITTEEHGVYRYRMAGGRLQHFDVPGNAAVYTIDVSADGSVWFGADEVGLVRLVADENGESSREVFWRDSGMRHDLFDHVRLTGVRSAWVATEEGGLYRFEGDRFHHLGSDKPYSDQTVYLVEPLPNGTVVLGGEQGLYQFRPGEERTVHYNQNAGFLGLENNVHATFLDADGWLWIGTIDGASRMDTSMPMPPRVDLTPQIVIMTTLPGDEPIAEQGELPYGTTGASIQFAAVSLSNPRDIELSYLIEGVDETWGNPTTNRMVEYTRIPPGTHRFRVRARYPGEDWSRSVATRQFTVVPFFWQRPTVIGAAALLLALLFRAAMVYRTRNIKRINEMLVLQVNERTRSIEEAKLSLQVSNERLSREVEERRKADKARLEVETRFRRAFENAPIGMGLLDADGQLFDANPALLVMLWGTTRSDYDRSFESVVAAEQRERFSRRYQQLVEGAIESLEERYDCVNAEGETLRTEFNVSTVHNDEGRFLYCVIQVQDLTESLRLTDQLEYQAKYDELTGLHNRRAFEMELETAWALSRDEGKHSYLLYMDLDQFKVVNDTSGHAAGDKLLQHIAEILEANVRANDTVGRMGGDEFAIILWKCPQSVAERIAESIRESVESFRFQWDTETYKVGVSIGGVQLDGRLGDISEIQQLADTACFTAKEDGRNRVHMVEGDKDSARAHRRQIRWVQRLREAMDNNRFAIYAQRIEPLAARSDEAPRYEILLRLRDPETRKLVPPGAFLPAAERYGLSIELDEWVIRNLINALFLHQSFAAEYRRYWINLSGLSIGEKRFATFLRRAVETSPLPPGTINFEITETAIIRNVAEAGHLIGELREMGCEFALDDFGSGLSSFGYLRKLPVSCLKVDGMFIRNITTDPTDRIFVKSIIDIAHTLDIRTTCELIETPEMLELVRELGADYAQGFAVERPFELAPCFPGASAVDDPTLDPQQKMAG